MSKADSQPEAEPIGRDDSLSATGMFLGGFRREPDPFEPSESFPAERAPLSPRQPIYTPAASSPGKASTPEASPQRAGEFTQIFGMVNPPSALPSFRPPVASPLPQARAVQEAPGVDHRSGSEAAPGEVTRMFAVLPAERAPGTDAFPTPAGAPSAPRVRGFSTPGVSDSASGEGSFTQMFRPSSSVTPRVPAPAPASPPPVSNNQEWPLAYDASYAGRRAGAAPESHGITDLFHALSATDGQGSTPVAERPLSFADSRPFAPAAPVASAPSDSFTVLIQKLTEHTPVPHHPETQPPMSPPTLPSGQGEFTRIIARDQMKTEVMAAPARSAAEPPPATLEKAASPAPRPAAPPKKKLQDMMPILLALNGFLMLVLIALVIFALMRK